MEVIFSVELPSFRVTILCCKTNQNKASSCAVLPDLKGSCINDFLSPNLFSAALENHESLNSSLFTIRNNFSDLA